MTKIIRCMMLALLALLAAAVLTVGCAATFDLKCDLPTKNTDGSDLIDLAEIRTYWADSPLGPIPIHSITNVPAAPTTNTTISWTVEATNATGYILLYVTAIDTYKRESIPSNVTTGKCGRPLSPGLLRFPDP